MPYPEFCFLYKVTENQPQPKIPLKLKNMWNKHAELHVCCGYVTAAIVLHSSAGAAWGGRAAFSLFENGLDPLPKSSSEQAEKGQVVSEFQLHTWDFFLEPETVI